MAINLYNIKKWYKMLTGNSLMHVNQSIGENFSKDCIKGYYNNLTEKVTKDKTILYTDVLPLNEIEDGRKVFFPIQIFQYGLGAFDLYIQTNDEFYLNKFKLSVEWTIKNQKNDGSWDNFSFVYPDAPYSAMAQGEGASLLYRAYITFNEKKYYDSAEKAIDFMLKPINEGGTAKIESHNLFLYEYTNQPLVLNGWIFAAFGLFDAYLLNHVKYKETWKNTIHSLIKYLPKFDNGYWSFYDMDKKLTSPFYHNLHIAQLQALYEITGEIEFKKYALKWTTYSNKKMNSCRAFIKKAIQKIKE